MHGETVKFWNKYLYIDITQQDGTYQINVKVLRKSIVAYEKVKLNLRYFGF